MKKFEDRHKHVQTASIAQIDILSPLRLMTLASLQDISTLSQRRWCVFLLNIVTIALGLYAVFFTIYLMPKIAGMLDTMLTRGSIACYGGWLRFASSAVIELIFSLLQGAASTIRTVIFMVGFLFGAKVNWGDQRRDSYGLTSSTAIINLWPQTLFGVTVCSALMTINPAVFWWTLPLTAGYLLAIPFAVLTASPALGRWMQHVGLAGVPENFASPKDVARAINYPTKDTAG